MSSLRAVSGNVRVLRELVSWRERNLMCSFVVPCRAAADGDGVVDCVVGCVDSDEAIGVAIADLN